MNRRDFIKAATCSSALATWTVTCKYEEPEQDPKGEKGEVGSVGERWDYIVCCYERGQGEWVFNENVKGSFAYQREYFTVDDEREFSDVYSGWMNQGKLRFRSFNEAEDFIDVHARTKDDSNVGDSIYDIYYLNSDELDYESARPKEIHVAQFWYNGDTGRQIEWKNQKYTL